MSKLKLSLSNRLQVKSHRSLQSQLDPFDLDPWSKPHWKNNRKRSNRVRIRKQARNVKVRTKDFTSQQFGRILDSHFSLAQGCTVNRYNRSPQLTQPRRSDRARLSYHPSTRLASSSSLHKYKRGRFLHPNMSIAKRSRNASADCYPVANSRTACAITPQFHVVFDDHWMLTLLTFPTLTQMNGLKCLVIPRISIFLMMTIYCT